MFDFPTIEKIIALFKKESLGEMTIQTDQLLITLKAKNNHLQAEERFAEISYKDSPLLTPDPAPIDNLYLVKAPLVGTFYRSADPNAPPLVSCGQKVTKGDPLGLIEAMKVLTLITAPLDGIIEEICIENSHGVQWDEILFRIKPLMS